MKLRVIDTEKAIDLMERYLTPISRAGIDNGLFIVELDEVVTLLLPDVEKWKWRIDAVTLASAISDFLDRPDVKIAEWSADDQTGFTIAIDYGSTVLAPGKPIDPKHKVNPELTKISASYL